MASYRARAWIRTLAAALLVAAWVCPLLVPHAGDDDRLCVPLTREAADASTVAPASSVQQPEHCAICHTARSFRAALLAVAGGVDTLAAQPVVGDPEHRPLRALGQDRLPARGPPVTSL
jgi:hypothetical protein